MSPPFLMTPVTEPKMHVGIVGAGLGGLTAAIAISRAGAQVTVLEAAEELTEIGAGIQIFGNVSRFLVRWEVDKLIGDNLVRPVEFNTWGHDGENKLIGRVDMERMEKEQGFPWWVVRRDHLHDGLTDSARQHGAELILGARVITVDHNTDGVQVTSSNGKSYKFDFLVGADGVNSVVRQNLFPDLSPRAVSQIAAYRGVVDYEKVYAAIPEARSILRNTIDAYVGPDGYVLLYPLSGGRELNIVTAFHTDHVVTTVEDVDINEFRDHYKDYPSVLRNVLNLMRATKRWPLLVVPPTTTWSNEYKNVVLMGDAIHSMQNHMAQGAATSMEDGVFLGRVISEVVRGVISTREAVHMYEKQRIPRVWIKQQAAFVNGRINTLSGTERLQRDRACAPEVAAFDRNPLHSDPLPSTYRPWQLFSSAETVPGILAYDAEADADFAICEYLQNKGETDPKTMVSKGLYDKWWNTVHNNGIARCAL